MAKHSTPRRKLDKNRVLETYYHEVQKRGSWGAYTRTAAIHHLSDETIRRYVKQVEQPVVLLDDDLVYVPCPGEKPAVPRELPRSRKRIRPKVLISSHSRMCRQYGLLRQAVRSKVGVVPLTECSHSPTTPCIPDTREWPTIPQKPPQPKPIRNYKQYGNFLVQYVIAPGPVLAVMIVMMLLLWIKLAS